MGTHPIFESDFDCLTEMLRSGSKALKRGFRVQFNCDLLPPQPIPPTDLAENNFVYFNGQSREGATAGEDNFAPRPFKYPSHLTDLASTQKCAAGIGFSVILANNRLYGTGLNSAGQLGLQMASKEGPNIQQVNSIQPIQTILKADTKILSLSAGRQHFGFTTDVEGVFLYGSNKMGQCGRRIDPKECTGSAPRFFQFDTRERFDAMATKISCGFDHTLVLLENGKVLAFGNGWDGQLGQADFIANHDPAFVCQPDGVEFVDVEAKGDWNLAVDKEGALWGWGNNEYQQISAEKVDRIAVPQVIDLNSRFSDREQKALKIAATSTQGFSIVQEGEKKTLYSWGFGYHGESNNFEPTTKLSPSEIALADEVKLRDVTGGMNAAALVTESGQILTWGKNESDILGHLDQCHIPSHILETPVSVGDVSIGMNHMIILGSLETQKTLPKRPVATAQFTDPLAVERENIQAIEDLSFGNTKLQETFGKAEEVETGRDNSETQKTPEPELERSNEPELHVGKMTNEEPHPLEAAVEDSVGDIQAKVKVEKNTVPTVEKTAPKMEVKNRDWIDSNEVDSEKVDRELHSNDSQVAQEKPVEGAQQDVATLETPVSGYKGKNFDPNFAARPRHVRPPTRHSSKVPRPPTPRAHNPRYQGKNFDPNYRPNFAPRPVRAVTTYGDVNVRAASQFRPRFSGQRPRTQTTSPPFQYRPRQPRAASPRHYVQSAESYRATAPPRSRQPRPTGYQGTNFRPNYRPRVRPQS